MTQLRWIKRLGMLAIVGALFASHIACGGLSLDNPGVDGSKQVKDMTAGDKENFKTAVNNEFNTEIMNSFCKFSAILAGSFATAFGQDGAPICQKQIDACDTTPTVSATITDKDVAECGATVDEVVACLKAQKAAVEKINEVLAPYSCDKLPGKDVTLDQKLLNPAACQTLAEKCPKQFGSDSTD